MLRLKMIMLGLLLAAMSAVVLIDQVAIDWYPLAGTAQDGRAVAYAPGDAFLFGPESRGLPSTVLELVPEPQRLRLPMRAGQRSLNLSNTVAVAVFEAWRQFNYAET